MTRRLKVRTRHTAKFGFAIGSDTDISVFGKTTIGKSNIESWRSTVDNTLERDGYQCVDLAE